MSARVATTLALDAFLLATGMVAVRTAKLLNIEGEPLATRHYGLQDFRDNVYYPPVAYLDGRNPWDWNDYRTRYPVARPFPPYTPIFVGLHMPLAALPYDAAEAAFFAVNAALLVAVAIVALRGAGVKVTGARALAIATLLVLSRPGHQTLFLGQVAPLMTLATGLALVHASARPTLASVGLLLACAKPTYGVPLALLLLARGDDRVALHGGALAAGVGGALAIAPARVAGGWLALLESARSGLAYMAANDASFGESTSVIRIDIASLVGRALGRPPSAFVSALITVSVLGLAALAVRRLRSVEPSGPRPLSAGVVVLALLLSLYHQAYDALLLVLPALALGAAIFPRGARIASEPLCRIPSAWKLAVLACLLVPAANYFSSSTLIRQLQPGHFAWLAVTGANGIATTAAFAMWLWLAFTQCPDARAA